MGDRLDLSVSKTFEAERLAAAAATEGGGEDGKEASGTYRRFPLEALREESRADTDELGRGVVSGSVSEAFCDAVRQNQFAILSLQPDSVEAQAVR